MKTKSIDDNLSADGLSGNSIDVSSANELVVYVRRLIGLFHWVRIAKNKVHRR